MKLDDPATLRAEVAEKLAAKAEQAAAKALNRLKERAEKVTKAEAAAVPPAELLSARRTRPSTALSTTTASRRRTRRAPT